jgi:hypothetical protein
MPREICSVNEDVFVKLVTMIAESKEKGGGGARVDVREVRPWQSPKAGTVLRFRIYIESNPEHVFSSAVRAAKCIDQSGWIAQ